jgi:signal transduction histidine kinase
MRPRSSPSWPTASLRTYLVAVILLATVPIALLMSVQIFTDVRSQRARLEDERERTAGALAQSVQRELAASIDSLTALTYAESLQRGDLPGFARWLGARPLMRTSWQRLYLRRPDGQVLFDTAPPQRNAAPDVATRAARAHADAAWRGYLAQPVGDAPSVSSLLVDPLSLRPANVIEVPVYVDGETPYRLGAWVDAAVWQQLIERAGAPQSGVTVVFDRDATVLARTLDPASSVGQRLGADARRTVQGYDHGSARIEMLGGGELYTTWRRVENAGWGVGVGTPAQPVEQAQLRAMLTALATAGGCLLLGLTLALTVARRVTHPLRELALHRAPRDLGHIPVREISLLRDALLAAEAQDFEARSRLQGKADEFEALFHSSPIGLAFALDRQCRVVMHNAAMTGLFGPPPPSLTKGGDAAAAPAQEAQVWWRGAPLARAQQPLQRAAAQGEVMPAIELEVRLPGQPARFVIAQAVPLLDDHGHPRGAIGAVVDISDRKQAERERAALAEREKAARLEAEAASRAKDEFLAMLGHELRNPLSAIASAVEVLNRVEADSDTGRDARQIIGRQTRHLARLMEDLLDVARVISGKVALSRQAIDLAALVDRLLHTLELVGASSQHRLTTALQPVWVQADVTRIEQIVGNLVTNAIKYTPTGKGVHVSVTQEDGHAVLRVRDEGMGIPQTLLPHVFDLFVQGERTLDRRAGGLGIGLTLVRRLVELHGGRIHASSSPQGSEFTVWLGAIEPPDTGPERQASIAPSRRRRVLLVEDNEDALMALQSVLELEGHTVSSAADGVSGLDKLLAERPEVAVVDIGLPGLTGYELALKARGAGYAGRMIALSGYGQGSAVRQALQAGFDAHLVKPVDVNELRLRLQDEG